MSNVAEPHILCENLVKIYKTADVELLALQGLDLNVERGEVMAIVGQSGSGKSTLMNILGGLDRPTAGKVSVGGRELLKLSQQRLNTYRRHNVGFVWQQTARNLIPFLNARENVELPMLMAGTPARARREWAAELLDSVGVAHRAGHRLDQLSGGEQQRVAIAVSLANKPELLLADEPTGELDSRTAQAIFDIFHDLNERYDITVMIVSHDAQIAQHVARVVAIRDGKTSTETLRHTVEAAEDGSTDEQHHLIEYTVLDAVGRLQLPEEYRERHRMGRRVTLESTPEGVIIRPIEGESDEATVKSLVENDDPPPPVRSRWRGRVLGALTGRRGRRGQS